MSEKDDFYLQLRLVLGMIVMLAIAFLLCLTGYAFGARDVCEDRRTQALERIADACSGGLPQ